MRSFATRHGSEDHIEAMMKYYRTKLGDESMLTARDLKTFPQLCSVTNIALVMIRYTIRLRNNYSQFHQTAILYKHLLAALCFFHALYAVRQISGH